ncbi:GGDEF domain-containing protein [Altericroceibacterium spongiae]|uniref:diguanylate cyclase n=2 Tax=Altericroceibacterium spongiae TaxID=2320269 RepID=A0A420EMU1_9SPHN|nr:GGDEF domain-containing protein [Altericroceibacterium spongiae]
MTTSWYIDVDFTTLYLVSFLDSIALSVIWAVIAWNYRDMIAARHWCLSAVFWLIGGLLLAAQKPLQSYAVGLAGNAFMLAGFTEIYIGVRLFYKLHSVYRNAFIFMAVSLACMLVSYPFWMGRNPVYLASFSVPLCAAAILLLKRGSVSTGSVIAAVGIALNLLAIFAWFIMNVLYVAHIERGSLIYFIVAANSLLVQLFSAMVWNFGLIVMAVDRLRGEVAKLAYEDTLTGLANRRFIVDGLSNGRIVPQEAADGASVLMVDVDKFKMVNDNYGHAAGDVCLQHIAGIIGSRLRRSDVFARIAGDEFCIFLPDTDIAGASLLAGDLVERVAETPLNWREEVVYMSISVGLSVWNKNNAGDVMTVLEEADAALYAVKKNGRGGHLSARQHPDVSAVNVETITGKECEVA